MLSAREAVGLSQADVADGIDIPTQHYAALERFDFTHTSAAQHASLAAGFLGIPVELVMPDNMLGRVLESDKTIIAECPQLADLAAYARHMLPSPQDSLDIDERKIVRDRVDAMQDREVAVLKRRTVGDMTLEETGREFGMTRERVRQVEAKAIRKLQADPALQKIVGIEPWQPPPTRRDVTPASERRKCRPLQLCTPETTP